jgi:hypothetical protein
MEERKKVWDKVLKLKNNPRTILTGKYFEFLDI